MKFLMMLITIFLVLSVNSFVFAATSGTKTVGEKDCSKATTDETIKACCESKSDVSGEVATPETTSSATSKGSKPK